MRRNIILQRKKVKVLLDAAKVIAVIPGRCGTHRTRNPEAAWIGFAVSRWIPDRPFGPSGMTKTEDPSGKTRPE